MHPSKIVHVLQITQDTKDNSESPNQGNITISVCKEIFGTEEEWNGSKWAYLRMLASSQIKCPHKAMLTLK